MLLCKLIQFISYLAIKTSFVLIIVLWFSYKNWFVGNTAKETNGTIGLFMNCTENPCTVLTSPPVNHVLLIVCALLFIVTLFIELIFLLLSICKRRRISILIVSSVNIIFLVLVCMLGVMTANDYKKINANTTTTENFIGKINTNFWVVFNFFMIPLSMISTILYSRISKKRGGINPNLIAKNIVKNAI